MIKATFLNATTGISKKSGNAWFRIQTVVNISSTVAIPFDAFVEEAVYAKVSNCRPSQVIGLKAGVNIFGNLCIVDVLTEPEAK